MKQKDTHKLSQDSLFSRALSVFLVAIETRKFSETAKRLDVTQSSVSQTIALLESRLGFSLFERDTRPLQPTSDALELYSSIKQSDEDIRQMLQRIRMRNWVKPAIRLGMIESVGSLVAPEVCQELKDKLGVVSLLSGPSGSLFKSVLNGDVDVGVIAGEESNKDVKKIFLYEDPWFLIFPKEFEVPEDLSWQSMSVMGLPLIYHSADPADGSKMQDFMRQHTLMYPKIYEAQSNYFVYALVANRLGWSFTHFFGLLGSERGIRDMKIAAPPTGLQTRRLYLVARRNYSDELLDIVKRTLISSVEKVIQRRQEDPSFLVLFK